MVIKVPHLFRGFSCDIILRFFEISSEPSLFSSALHYCHNYFFYPILHNPSSTIHHYQPLIQSILAYNLTNKFENSLPTNLYLKIDNSTNNLANPSKIENDVKRILLWTPFFGVKDYGFGIGRDAFIKA
jgi:hypothetical protein